MAGNKVTLTFAGDSDSLVKAAARAEKATTGVADEIGKSSKQVSDAAGSTADFTTKMGHLGSAVSGATDAFGAIGGSLDAVNQLQHIGAERAEKLQRSLQDVRQAQEDYNQALQDGRQAKIDENQASIDLEQANLDVASATKDYNKAVKDHGKNSDEAKQAMIDMKQAQHDVTQAQADSEQATRDAQQAVIDAKDAQLNLNDANKEANPPDLQKWSDDLQTLGPLLSGLAGLIGIATAAQWLFNASLWASPITWIVLAVAALVAIIIIVATKTTWFQDIWHAVWDFLKGIGEWFAGPFKDFFVKGFDIVKDALSSWWDKIKAVPGQLKDIFSKVVDFISAPFKAAFNIVSDAWNNTIGRLHWTVPDWVPGIGGRDISAPRLPHFHTGGIVSGALGSETLAVLQAGERVTTAGGGGGDGGVLLLGSDGSDIGDFLIEQIRKSIARRGGDANRVLSNRRG